MRLYIFKLFYAFVMLEFIVVASRTEAQTIKWWRQVSVWAVSLSDTH